MRYCSTRGGERGVSFEDCLMRGYAADGGMFMPESVPAVSQDTLELWRSLSYVQLVTELAKLYVDVDEISHDELTELIGSSYVKFSEPPIEIAQLADGLRVAELFHGPTMAFKDLSLGCVARFMNYFLLKRGQHATVIVATSGDTGGAAIESFRGLKAVDLIVLYPKGGCNEFQELQMTTASESNIHCFAVDGNSDDEDEVMLAVIRDTEFASRHNLTLANSCNWGRILVQIAHYFFIYLRMSSPDQPGAVLPINVPSGGGGNILGGCLAQRMGLPIALVPCTNSNDVLHKCLTTGHYTPSSSRVVPTLASAMDIGVPYNLERIFHLFSDGQTDVTKSLMETVEKEGKVDIPDDLLAKIRTALVSSVSINDADILLTMQSCWTRNKYIICPHTATAVARYYSDIDGHETNRLPGTIFLPTVCIATASPNKFPETLAAAGVEQPPNTVLEQLRQKKVRFERMAAGQDWIQILRAKICEIGILSKV